MQVSNYLNWSNQCFLLQVFIENINRLKCCGILKEIKQLGHKLRFYNSLEVHLNQVHTYVPHTIIRKKVNSYSKQVLKINQVILSQSELNFMKSFKCGKAKTLSWHCGLKIEKCWLNKNTANFSNSSRHKIEKCWLDENTESLSHSSSQEIGKIFQVIN